MKNDKVILEKLVNHLKDEGIQIKEFCSKAGIAEASFRNFRKGDLPTRTMKGRIKKGYNKLLPEKADIIKQLFDKIATKED